MCEGLQGGDAEYAARFEMAAGKAFAEMRQVGEKNWKGPGNLANHAPRIMIPNRSHRATRSKCPNRRRPT